MLKHRREVIETMLVKEAGFTLRDIRGTESRSVEVHERTGLVARFRRWCPYLEDPDPIRKETVEKEEGLSEQQVLRFLVYHDEMEEIKEEKREESMREARRKSGNLKNNSSQSQRPTTMVNTQKRP
jgi:hypothetical protein